LQLSKQCNDFVGRLFAENYREEARAPSIVCAFSFMLSTVRTIVLSAVFILIKTADSCGWSASNFILNHRRNANIQTHGRTSTTNNWWRRKLETHGHAITLQRNPLFLSCTNDVKENGVAGNKESPSVICGGKNQLSS